MSDIDPITSRFVLIGLITVTWARLEGSIDVCNDLAFGRGGNLVEKHLPKSMTRKLRFMRRCHNELPALCGVKDRADALVESINALRQRRNDLIHGVAMSFPTGDFLHTFKLSHGESGLAAGTASFSNDDLQNLFLEIVRVFNLAEEHVLAVEDAFLAQSPKDQGGQF